MIKSVLILSSLLALAVTYDYSDTQFNKFLLDDFESLDEFDEDLYRPRRDAAPTSSTEEKCKKRSPMPMCCGTDMEVPFMNEEERKVKKQCFAEMKNKSKESKPEADPFSCEKMKSVKKNISCAMECVGRRINLVDQVGNIKEPDFKKYLKEKYSSESWAQSMMEKGAENCWPEVRKAVEDSKKKTKNGETKCNPSVLKMVHCVWKYVQYNCPEDFVQNDSKCKRIRDKLLKKKQKN